MIQGTLCTSTQEKLPDGAPALLHHFFENSARKWPHRTAVDVPPGLGRPQRRLTTYAELARQAHAVAAALHGAIGRDAIAAILLPRDSERIYSAQLGVLRAGGAFASIDPSFPDGRIREILEDSQAAALVTDRAGAARARSARFAGRILLAAIYWMHSPTPRRAFPRRRFPAPILTASHTSFIHRALPAGPKAS